MSKGTVVKTLNLDSHVEVVRSINNAVVNSSQTPVNKGIAGFLFF